ncbi:hypothetical protein Micbo1qcDRAFT_191218 [Microdochium bolleyi]|uniref:N-acetyltransferase domain-containing protein n=1 Tax=Microdochium bolleyi TaxID=196109 RepID=A0A136JH12_9PEZI|nr:hypothetical protein Micbo1qcDRAFT_191218 [Microdochium bolleyi]
MEKAQTLSLDNDFMFVVVVLCKAVQVGGPLDVVIPQTSASPLEKQHPEYAKRPASPLSASPLGLGDCQGQNPHIAPSRTPQLYGVNGYAVVDAGLGCERNWPGTQESGTRPGSCMTKKSIIFDSNVHFGGEQRLYRLDEAEHAARQRIPWESDSSTPKYVARPGMDTTSDAGAAPLPAGYTMQEGYPPLAEYLNLRKASGLTPVSPGQGAMVPGGSWYGVYITVAENDDDTATSNKNGKPIGPQPRKAVAMGRIIGDGGWYFVIADIAVLPDHQRRGLGDAIVKTLVARVNSHAARGQAYVTLTADPPGRKLYARNGFRETMPAGLGMCRLLQVPGREEEAEE